jgi:N-acyl-D-aspartate/D-glutamate deacylase
MHDIAIRGGVVIDGTGAPASRADIGITSGRITAIGEVGAARRTIEADGQIVAPGFVDGQIVAPGFVDVHTHIDAQVCWDTTLSPSSLHGVTTMLAGNCGFTLAPINEHEADYLVRMLAIVEGMPLEALQAGVPCTWTSTGEYLDYVDHGLAVNTGFMVGHSALRRVVMREDATKRAATPQEVEAMVQMLRAGLSTGALGFSSSYGIAHSDANGDPVPSRFAPVDELVTLARQCRDFEGTSLEFLPKFVDRFDTDQAALLAGLSVAAQRPLNWNVLRITVKELAEANEALRQSDHAKDLGGKVVGLTMPIPSRARFSFFTGFVLNALPGWGEVLGLPHEQRVVALRDPEVRRRLAESAPNAPGPMREISEWDRRIITETFTPQTKKYEGRVVADIAREEGKSAFDALLDIVCEDNLLTMFTRLPSAPSADDWQLTVEACRTGRTMIGASDAGAHLDFTAYFDYPVYVIEQAVRRYGVLALEEAVQMLTSIPADLYGLRDRGRLVEGAHADVVVFDADSVASGTIGMRFDLPAGAGRLYAEPEGVAHVLVNGQPIVLDSKMTDERPGTLFRAGRDTATPAL